MSITLRLDGFRSHASRKIVFPEGKATYICGRNGTGKTDIYRAIRWVLFPKKNDKIHPLNTSTTVRVSLHMPGIRIVRTALEGSLILQYKNKTYHNADAEVLISALFGSREAWNLSSYVKAGIHPYILASSQKRAEIFNEFIEETKAKENLAGIISQVKAELKLLNTNHEREMIRYEAVYGKEVVNVSKILTEEEREEVKNLLGYNRKLLHSYQAEMNEKTLVLDKVMTSKSIVDKLSPVYSASELEEMRTSLACSTRYNAAKSIVDSLKTSGARSSSQKVEQEDLDNTLVAERDYRSSLDSFKKLGLQHSEASRTEALEDYELSLKYGEIALSNSRYRELEASCPKICSSIEESLKEEEELVREITSLTESIKHDPSFEKHSQVNELLSKLPSDLASFCLETEREISLQQVHLERKKYEDEYSLVMGSLPDERPEEIILSLLVEVRTSIENIERSKIVICCPHCSGKVIHSGGSLIKFEGVIQEGDVSALKRRLQNLSKLAAMRYPPSPECRVIKDIPKEQERVRLARRCITLQASLTPIPEEVKRLVVSRSEANSLLESKKKKLPLVREYTKIRSALGVATKPQEVPENVKVVSREVALEGIENLKKLKFCSRPSISSATIRLQLKLQEAEAELSRHEKPLRFISENELREYSSKLATLEVAREQLREAELALLKLPVTQELLTSTKQLVRRLEGQLQADKKYSVMDKQAQAICKLCDELDAKQREYDDACEYREIFDRDFDIRVKGSLQGLAADVNHFLDECGSEVRVEIPTEGNKTKIVCFKSGSEVGNASELSDGEESLVSFSFRIAFCLLAKNNFIILDEVTEKLDPEFKDRCIELMLEVTKKAGKTVLLTDHHCHSGDYDKIIDLNPKEKDMKEAD